MQAAVEVLTHLATIRAVMQPQPIDPHDLLRAITAALTLGRLDDDLTGLREFVRQVRAQQTRARAAAEHKRTQYAADLAQLRRRVAQLHAADPLLTRTAIARRLDAAHVDKMRKRIERLELLDYWHRRRRRKK